MKIERKIIDIFILDRERKTRKVIYHNPSSPTHLFLSDLNKYDIKVTIYEIKNNKEILLFKEIPPNLSNNKLIGFKKLKLVFTDIIDLANFKFNPKLNWNLIF
jgi:hypothetical protein